MRLGLGRVGRVRAGWLPAYVVGTATAEVAQEAGVAGEQLRVELGLAVLAREEAAVVLQLADLAQMLAIYRAPIVLDRVDQVVQLSLASQPLRDLKLAADDVLQVLLAGLLAHRLSPRLLLLPRRHLRLALALPLLVAFELPSRPIGAPPATHLFVPPAAWWATASGPWKRRRIGAPTFGVRLRADRHPSNGWRGVAQLCTGPQLGGVGGHQGLSIQHLIVCLDTPSSPGLTPFSALY